MSLDGQYTPTAWVMLKHVKQMARTHQIRVLFDPKIDPRAAAVAVMDDHPDDPFVVIAGVWDEVTYCVALHEIGHLCHPRGTQLKDRNAAFARRDLNAWIAIYRNEEESAWEWARVNAVQWTPTMQATMDWAFGSYVEQFEQLVEGCRKKNIPDQSILERFRKKGATYHKK